MNFGRGSHMRNMGERLFLLRSALGLTQVEVASKSGISREYISKIEAGLRSGASRDVIKSLSRELNATEAWLARGQGWSYCPPSYLQAGNFIERQIKGNGDIKIVFFRASYLRTEFEAGLIFRHPGYVLSMDFSRDRDVRMGVLKMLQNVKTSGNVILQENEYLRGTSSLDMSALVSRDKIALVRKKAIAEEANGADTDTSPDNELIFASREEAVLIDKIRKANAGISEIMRFADGLEK